MIKRFKVAGHSMEPIFSHDDKILVKSFLFNLKIGDVVVFREGNKDYLKRITAASKNSFTLSGDNKNHSSTHTINRRQVKGKFLMKY